MPQVMRCEGDTVVITRQNKVEERHQFRSRDEAIASMRTVAEALTWLGTPFRDQTDVRGPRGGIDCAMMLVRSYVDSERLPPFEPRPYSSQWHLHHGEEKFLEWIEAKLGGRRVARPRLSDVVVFQYGRCFSHGAIVINSDEIVHAYEKSGICHTSWIQETDLCFLRSGKPRPRLYFEVRP